MFNLQSKKSNLGNLVFFAFIFLICFGTTACNSIINLATGDNKVIRLAKDYCDLDVTARKLIRDKINNELEEEAYIRIVCKGDIT